MKTEPSPFQIEILSSLHEAGGKLPVNRLGVLFKKKTFPEATLESLEKKGYVRVDCGIVELVEPPEIHDWRSSPRLNAKQMAEMEHLSDFNLIHHYAEELKLINSGTPPYRLLSASIIRKLELAGLLIRDRRWGLFLSEECLRILDRLCT